jgi:hypothetical protein
MSMRTVRGGRRARRMAAQLTKGGWAPMRWWMGQRGSISSRAVAQSRRRGSPASGRRRARWRRLGGRGGEGHQRSARRCEGGTGGQPERLGNTRTLTAGGRCRPTASGTLRLPARTRGSGEKCRGRGMLHPERKARRGREKRKGGTTATGRRTFTGGGGGRMEAGGLRRGVAPRGRRKRGGSRWRVERGGVRRNLIQFQISNEFKFFQSLTDLKMTFSSSKILK